jgi:hypothetical protein
MFLRTSSLSPDGELAFVYISGGEKAYHNIGRIDLNIVFEFSSEESGISVCIHTAYSECAITRLHGRNDPLVRYRPRVHANKVRFRLI